MKPKIPIFVLLVGLLGISLFSTGNIIAQTSGPNTNFETGDNFFYNSDSTRFNNWLTRNVFTNDTDPTQLFRYEEFSQIDEETIDGDLELFLVKPNANLPQFNHPEFGAYDHVLIIDWQGVSITPSTRFREDKFFDAGAGAVWDNITEPVEDTTGRHYSNEDDEGWQPVVSNATYAILMSEMTDNTYDTEIMNWMPPGFDLGTFSSQIPLVSRSVTTETGRQYNINGLATSIDTRNVFVQYEGHHIESFLTSLSFGDPNDPNTPSVGVNATLDIYTNYEFWYNFDQTTGMLLEFYESKYNAFDISYTNSSYVDPFYDPNNPNGPSSMAIEFYTQIITSETQNSMIESASSFYGNNRVLSSGNNRIEEGHLLSYTQDSESNWNFNSDSKAGDPLTTGYERFDENSGVFTGTGTANFDVYRHQPGSFDSVLVMQGTQSGEVNSRSHGTDRNLPYDHPDTFTISPRDYLQYDYMSFQSTPSEEIQHFFDPSMHFNDDFLYDDKDQGFDGWRLNYNRDLPKSGVESHTTEHKDLATTELVDINGFTHTWFDLDVYTQKYEIIYNAFVDIPIERDEQNGDQWISVKMNGSAIGEQSFYYDQATGVLLHMEQRVEVHFTLDGTGTVHRMIDNPDGTQLDVTLNVNFFASIDIIEKWSITLQGHPIEYQTAEAADPVDHTPVTTPPPGTTTPVETTPDDTTSSDLPLPVPILPVLSALGIIILYIRKRK